MDCPRSQTTNPTGAKFCTNCGASLLAACSFCATPLGPDARFCHNCGHSVAEAPPSLALTSPPADPGSAATRAAATRLQEYMSQAFRARRNMEGERRVVTVLFCDVKGSTARAEKLEPTGA
ncbi:MAG: zinc ribbon domain-containing protein [Ardenticatenaceae bacterium]|nr:zinc ribbon domain-containing protein [Ardenticatenaceae bacterium]HBY94440.1 hypothetical protein [Chloroflexota bacterium]